MITKAKHAAMVRVLEARMQSDAPEEPMDPEEMMREVQWFGSTAIIPVHGVIVNHASDIPMSSCGCGMDSLAENIDMALNSPSIDRVIFDFRTPGGSVTGVPEAARKIYGIPSSKETIAFTDSECCSAGMWLASQCQSFYATESASIGSIGVWSAYEDWSGFLEEKGVNIQEISAGRYKTMGAYWKPLTKEERQMIQTGIDKIYGQFKDAVNTRRQVSEEFMQGQIFDGPEAVEAGLIDGLVESMQDLMDQ